MSQAEINQSIVDLLRVVNKRFDILEAQLDMLSKKVDVVRGDLLALRHELHGVIDPDFPAVGAGQ